MIATKSERGASVTRTQTDSEFVALASGGARRELVRRVVLSPTFARSERLSTLLTFVCDMALKGRGAEINEQKIGHTVFGRAQDYDSAVDGIVRTQASRLRQRLDLYFQQEGADEPVRIVIPRGGYVPIFESRPVGGPASATASLPVSLPVNVPAAPVAELTAASPEIASAPAAQTAAAMPRAHLLHDDRLFHEWMRWMPWALCAALGFTLLAILLHDRHALQPTTAIPRTHALWSHLFSRDQPTLVVTADSGLVMFHNMSEQYMGLNDYLDGKYRAELRGPARFGPAKDSSEWAVNLAGRRYTSMVDLNTVLSLEQRARTLQDELFVRYARDLRPNDLKTGNVILLGASEANPWVELFERNMNFVFRNDYRANVFSVLNRSPHQGEPAQWSSSWDDPQRRVYGLVAYVPSLAGEGNALILEGTSMSGTEGAWDFVADDAQLLPFLKRIERPDGTLPHFELLLETQNMSASAVQSHILAWRSMN